MSEKREKEKKGFTIYVYIDTKHKTLSQFISKKR
jgi:hypothetical protein